MTPEVFQQLSEEAHKALHRHHLHDAIYLINILLKEVHLAKALDDCQQLQDNYARMLQFISSGGMDENSQLMRSQMMENALQLLIEAEREYRLEYESGSNYAKCELKLKEQQESIESVMEKLQQTHPRTVEREALLDLAFYAIWTSSPLNAKTEACLSDAFRTKTSTPENNHQAGLNLAYDSIPALTHTEEATLTSALSLSLIEYVDARKLTLLLQQLESEDNTIRVRALAGISFCAMLHHEDFALHTQLVQQLTEDYLKRDDIQEIIALLNLTFLLCLQTQSAHDKMEKDIIPGFMKIAKDGRVNLGFTMDGELDMDIPVKNPKERKELRNNMKAFFDMHRDGIDMNATTMLSLRNMDFFKELPHWFLPFDKNRTEVRSLMGNGDEETTDLLGLVGKMAGSGDCDTDRYSSAIVFLKHLSPELKDEITQMAKSVTSDDFLIPGFVKVQDNTNNEQQLDDTKHLCRRYMQQLYRVFTMWPTCQEWKNPFVQSANWLENPILSPALTHNRKSLHMLTDFLVKYENYGEAEAYLNRLVKLEGSDAETLRSAAFCKQKQGHYGAAITLYNQADLLSPNHVWTLAQMQLCYAQMDRHEQRLDCLLQLEQLEPDNAKIISETGLCLMQLQRWQEASQRFFRLELEDRHVVPSCRAIAWCSLQQGKFEQALRYYKQLLDSTTARWQDYLNAGHATWLLGHTSEAVNLYREYIKRYLTDDPKITDSMTPFNADNQLLLSLGKQQHEIDLMHDILEQNSGTSL